MNPLPLTPANRLKLARAFGRHVRVDMSIDCAVEGQMGEAFVDDVEQPTVFLLLLGGFFAYFAGDPQSPAAGALAAATAGPKLIMPAIVDEPDPWSDLLRSHHGDRLIAINRYRFTSRAVAPAHLQQLLDELPHARAIRRIDEALAQQLSAQPDSVLDMGDFDSPHDFTSRSIGYAYLTGDDPANTSAAGVAYGSLVCSRGIEVSIFVDPQHRRRGVATALGAALLQYCLAHNMDANWDAANPESCALAEKLGYTPLGPYTAHFLRG